jgi:hypothetical protein
MVERLILSWFTTYEEVNRQSLLAKQGEQLHSVYGKGLMLSWFTTCEEVNRQSLLAKQGEQLHSVYGGGDNEVLDYNR